MSRLSEFFKTTDRSLSFTSRAPIATRDRWGEHETSHRVLRDDAPTFAPPRIALLSASVGSGHIRAAQALEAAIRQRTPLARIEHIDVLELTNAVFRRVYSAGYFKTVATAPHLIAMMYDLLDRPGDGRLSDRARIVFERLNFSRLTQKLSQEPWDLAICTHFLPAELLGWLRNSGRIDYPFATVVTDFDVHGMWINPQTDTYFVATEEARQTVLARSSNATPAVEVTGIPIDKGFCDATERAAARKALGLRQDLPVVLQLAGGFGIGPIQTIFSAIHAVSAPLQLIVVTGKNEAACEQPRLTPTRHSTTLHGYTSQMHTLMAAADVVVTKPGGLTTAECLASGCAILIVQPIPGQEDRNAQFVLENGAGAMASHLSGLTHKLASLLADPARLTRLQQSAIRCARPRAAADIAAACQRLTTGRASLARRNALDAEPALVLA